MDIYSVSVWILPVLVALCLHESAHAWAAWKLGDPTAKMLGRVSINPVRHIHPVGTVLLPIFLLVASNGTMAFGFAKPVPINPRNFRNPRLYSALVAAAGPLCNLVIALVVARFLVNGAESLFGPFDPSAKTMVSWVFDTLIFMAWINVFLFVLNMLPILPLDGGRVVHGLLPLAAARVFGRIEPYGFMIILLALLVLPYVGHHVGVNLDIARYAVVNPAVWIMEQLLSQ